MLRATALAALVGLLAGSALAQDACQRTRAELATLSDGGAESRAAVQLAARYHAIGCEGGQFLFFDVRPAECASLAQRVRALQVEASDAVTRQRGLRAAAAQACGSSVRSAGDGERLARGGGQVICVRTCDGGFFPMDTLPEGRGGADALCQALCPGTEAVAYSMPTGGDALAEAAAIRDRRAYTSLANAFKFRTQFSPGCACRRDGESWAQSLARAERMLDRHEGDLIVTAARAEALSRPRLARATPRPPAPVPVGDGTVVSAARPVTPATASLAARQDAPAGEASLDARVETTGSLGRPGGPVRVIPPASR